MTQKDGVRAGSRPADADETRGDAAGGVRVETVERTLVVTIDRPHRRNAVDAATAAALLAAFEAFDQDEGLDVAVLTGAGRTFCAGADLQALVAGSPVR